MGKPDVSHYHRSLTYSNATQKGCIAVYGNPVFDNGMAGDVARGTVGPFPYILRPNGNALIYSDIIADYGGLPYNHPRAVVDGEMMAYRLFVTYGVKE